ncbi:MAG: hypothetical protein H7Z75_03710 [Ferruginibacter sp.]|nr:hypothetical protein [Cytophagales bacterium]
METFQSFLWVAVCVVAVFVVIKLIQSFFKWILILLIIGVVLYQYTPTRIWLHQLFADLTKG